MLKADIEKAITENLPQMVGEELRKTLNDYEKMKEDYKAIDRNYEKLSKNYEELSRKDRKYEDNEAKEAELKRKEAGLQVKEEILKIREKHAEERVNEIRQLTQTVFQSNRMNYNVDLNKSKYTPGNPSNNYHSTTSNETVTGVIGSME